MLNNYRIYRRKQELGRRITRLHNTEQLAVGILDTGSLEQLTSCLDWYTSEMNFSLHVVTQEGRFDLTGMQEAYKDVTFLVFTSHTFTGEKKKKKNVGEIRWSRSVGRNGAKRPSGCVCCCCCQCLPGNHPVSEDAALGRT